MFHFAELFPGVVSFGEAMAMPGWQLDLLAAAHGRAREEHFRRQARQRR